MTSSVSQNFFLLNILSRCIKITLKFLLPKFKSKIQVLCHETFYSSKIKTDLDFLKSKIRPVLLTLRTWWRSESSISFWQSAVWELSIALISIIAEPFWGWKSDARFLKMSDNVGRSPNDWNFFSLGACNINSASFCSDLFSVIPVSALLMIFVASLRFILK